MMRIVVVGLALGTAVLAADLSSSVTFSKDVLPILQKNCQGCHRPGQVAPMSLISYKDTRPWARAIKAAVILKKMPPWFADPKYGHFMNDRSLKQSEIDTLAKWADTGVAEGDAKDAPAPIDWPNGGWEIQPEIVMDLPPHDVPPKGVRDQELIPFPAPSQTTPPHTSLDLLRG